MIGTKNLMDSIFGSKKTRSRTEDQRRRRKLRNRRALLESMEDRRLLAVVAGVDFDGGAGDVNIVAGSSFNPATDNKDGGGGDWFGVGDQATWPQTAGVPFSIADDSVVGYSGSPFPADDEGIFGQAALGTNEYFGMSDLRAGGPISPPETATWTFNVSGETIPTSLNFAVDFGSRTDGDFDYAAGTSILFEASIDGGTPQTLIEFTNAANGLSAGALRALDSGSNEDPGQLLFASGDATVEKTFVDSGVVSSAAADLYTDKSPASGTGAGLLDTFSTTLQTTGAFDGDGGTPDEIVLTVTATLDFEAAVFDNVVFDNGGAGVTTHNVTAVDSVKAEGTGGTTDYTFEVSRAGDTSVASSVELDVIPGDTNASDFFGGLPANIPVSFTAGQTTPETVTITVVGDSTAESSEDFQVEINTPSIGVIGQATADGTIIDDDTAAPPIEINEVRISSPGSIDDSSNFVELVDTGFASGTNLDEVTIVVLSSEFNPGQIDFAIPLAGGSTDANGYFLLADDGTSVSLDSGDLSVAGLDFFGSPSVIMAVKGFNGQAGVDLDATDDGTLDSTPWVEVIDAVAFDDDESPDADPDFFYVSETSATIVGDGVNDGFVPSGLAAFPNGSDSFGVLPFETQINDTPGAENGEVILSVGEIVVQEESVANATSVTFDVTYLGAVPATISVALGAGTDAAVTAGSSLAFAGPGTLSVTIDGISDSLVEGSESDVINFTSPGLTIPSLDVTILDDDVVWQLNEVRAQAASGDDDSNNFVEIVSTDGTDLVGGIESAGLTLLVVSADFSPGEIDFAIPLDGDVAGFLASGGVGESDGDGFLLIADDGNPGFNIEPGDILVSDTSQASPNGFDPFGSPATFILVEGFTGSQGEDLDTNDDGTLDSTPWATALDSVTTADSIIDPDFRDYEDELGGQIVEGVGSGFPPGGIAARPDGSDLWEFTTGLGGPDPFFDTSFDTPGSTNEPKLVIGESLSVTGAHEGGKTDTLDISLSIPPAAGDVIVTLTPDAEVDLGAGAGVAISLPAFNAGNFGVPQTVTVTAVDDSDVEGDHDGTITITTSAAMDPDFDMLSIDPVNVNIADNENSAIPSDLAVNEIRLSTQNQTVDDLSNNFFEAHSASVGADLTDTYLVVISEAFNPGLIDFAIPLDGGSTDSDGVFLLTDTGNPAGYPFDIGIDLEAPSSINFDFFGSESSYAIVSGFTAQAGVDLDTDDDGIVDGVEPWDTVFDDVTLSFVGGAAVGGYFNPTPTARVELPVGPFAPSGVRRVPDGTGPYAIMQFNDLGQDTPGESNVLTPGIRIVDLSVTTNPGINTDLDLQEDPSSGPDSFSVVLDSPPTSNVTISVSDLLGQTTATPSTLTFTPSDWFEQQLVEIDAIDDLVTEGNHSDTIRLTVDSGSAAEYLALPAIDLNNVEIIDNDAAANAVVINEVHKDPFGFLPTDVAGDANGDGIRDAFDDEFIELFNTGGSVVDISGFTLEDQVGVRHVIPGGTLLSPGGFYVVFAGGTPTGSFGGAIVDTASTGALGLSNNVDQVTLRDDLGTALAAVSWNVDDGIDDGVDNSLARIPNGTGAFEDQGNIDGFLTLFTPGITNDGSAVASVIVAQTDGSNDVKEGGLTDSIDISLATTPTSPVDITVTPDLQLDLGAGAGNPIVLSGVTTSATSVSIAAFDDALVEGGHIGTISFSVSQPGGSMEYDGLAVAGQSVNILDDTGEADFRINEARISAIGGLDDTENFIEIVETGFQTVGTDGLTLVILSGEFDPGQVDFAIPLNGGDTDAGGFFNLGQIGATNYVADGTDLALPSSSFDPFGSPSTILLVSGSTVTQGTDLDADDDGVLDITPWDMVYDAVSFDDAEAPEVDVDFEYSTQLGFAGQVIDNGVNDGFVPAGVFRTTDATGAFDTLDISDLSFDTASETNVGGDTIPPTITDVIAAGSGWGASFLTNLASDPLGLSLPGADQLRNLPWNNVDTFYVGFSEDIGSISASDVTLTGVSFGTYALSSVTYNPATFTAQIVVAAPIAADNLTLTIADTVTDLSGNALDGEWVDTVSLVSGDTVAGGNADIGIDILPGDVDNSSDVGVGDLSAVAGSLFTSDPFADVDATGDVGVSDLSATAGLLFTGINSRSSGGGSGSFGLSSGLSDIGSGAKSGEDDEDSRDSFFKDLGNSLGDGLI